MYYVYVLLCADKSFYTGISNDPEKRFQDHIKGNGGAYTRSHIPQKILYTEICKTKSDALRREAEIKRWRRARKILELGLSV